MTTKGKEQIVPSYVLHMQHFLPHTGQLFFEKSGRHLVCLALGLLCDCARKQSPAVHFPRRSQWQAFEEHKLGGDHKGWQKGLEIMTALLLAYGLSICCDHHA